MTGLAFLILVMRFFYPYHRLAAIVVYVLSWIPFILSYHHKRPMFEAGEQWLVQYWPYLFFLVGLFLFIYILLVLFPTSSPLSKLTDEELSSQMEGDISALVYLDQEMGSLLQDMETSGYF